MASSTPSPTRIATITPFIPADTGSFVPVISGYFLPAATGPSLPTSTATNTTPPEDTPQHSIPIIYALVPIGLVVLLAMVMFGYRLLPLARRRLPRPKVTYNTDHVEVAYTVAETPETDCEWTDGSSVRNSSSHRHCSLISNNSHVSRYSVVVMHDTESTFRSSRFSFAQPVGTENRAIVIVGTPPTYETSVYDRP
jgi:hypothetical protein